MTGLFSDNAAGQFRGARGVDTPTRHGRLEQQPGGAKGFLFDFHRWVRVGGGPKT
jgi:hypothetical protein